MGDRLASEIRSYIEKTHPGGDEQPTTLDRISFIGFSLGGLIIRAALPRLYHLQDKFHALVTLCSPHLGYLYKEGGLFNTGMWFMENFQESTIIS